MKRKRIIKRIFFLLCAVLLLGMFFPTWTSHIKGKNSISELRQIKINGTRLELMIRGKDTSNPVLLFVHGGPANSEIPYAKKYQDLLEQRFTVVQYDQRGSGKSFHFFESYKDMSIQQHVDDLRKITDYLRKRFQKETIIHSLKKRRNFLPGWIKSSEMEYSIFSAIVL